MKGILLTPAMLLLLWLSTSFVSSPSQSFENQWFCEELKYTYQIQMHTRGLPQLPATVCDDIRQARKASERAFIKYTDAVTVVVFSEQEIQQLNTTTKEVVYEF